MLGLLKVVSHKGVKEKWCVRERERERREIGHVCVKERVCMRDVVCF